MIKIIPMVINTDDDDHVISYGYYSCPDSHFFLKKIRSMLRFFLPLKWYITIDEPTKKSQPIGMVSIYPLVNDHIAGWNIPMFF